ncbi:serine/threonine-protein kinase pim-1-like [Ictalurus furcatus]|uniref:serine/threonine-protein kinase pim-1-like n=1 Tax=Ictalurus furcatus TaxID=66913 RepID=UPI00234FB759|nr:serine/threonine-protein kinase pim-1-like [Ictalurus furcatus]
MKYMLKMAEDSVRGEKPWEVALMEMVSKPPPCVNVVELLERIDVCTSFVLVLERSVPCMDLRKFCESKKDGRLSERLSRDIMLQVFRAAHHCFKRGVVHGDIRADNVLVNTDTLEVKLIDFGCGEFLLENYICTSYSGRFRGDMGYNQCSGEFLFCYGCCSLSFFNQSNTCFLFRTFYLLLEFGCTLG